MAENSGNRVGRAGPRRGVGVSSPARSATRYLHTAAVLLVLLFLFSGCHFNYGDDSLEKESSPDALFRNFTYTVIIQNERVLEIKAEHAESYTSENRTELQGITFTQFDGKTQEALAVGRADSAVIHTDTENAEFSGSVVLNWKTENTTLKAEALSWDSAKKELSSRLDQDVEIEKADGTRIRGAGFTASTRKRDFLFRDSVEGAFSLKDK